MSENMYANEVKSISDLAYLQLYKLNIKKSIYNVYFAYMYMIWPI